MFRPKLYILKNLWIDCPFSYSEALKQIEEFPPQVLGPLEIIISHLESLACEISGLDGHGGKLVAVKGDWGTGKTSALLAIEEYFREIHGWPTVFFQPGVIIGKSIPSSLSSLNCENWLEERLRGGSPNWFKV